MTSPEISVGMWCWPGPRAAAGVQEARPGEPVLALFLDPVNLVLSVPPFPDGPTRAATFLRELSRAAGAMADEIDPMPQPSRSGGAHRASSVRGVRAGGGDESW